jgi:hypothetical protein
MRTKLAALAAVALAACVGQIQYVAIARSPGGAIRVDEDGDGYGGAWICPEGVSGCDAVAMNAQPIKDLDCNDHDRGMHPGATDVPGDGIDQNCDGADGLREVLPAPTSNVP